MAITASVIHNQSFSIDRKGYDVDEVDEFLEFVAKEIDALNNTISELEAAEPAPIVDDMGGFDVPAADVQDDFVDAEPADAATLAAKDARIAELERQLKEKKANDNAIAQALIIAQRTADEIVAKANDVSDDIIAEAREEAARIIAEANEDKAAIEGEIVKLDGDCETIRERFQVMLKDFINDATEKLADISESSIHASIAARANKMAARNYETPVAPARTEAPAAMDYSTPIFGATKPVEAEAAPAVPMAFIGEKDLSGFGDAMGGDFEFDDLD